MADQPLVPENTSDGAGESPEGLALPAGARTELEGVNYVLPQSLTPQGRNEFNRRIQLMINELTMEINWQTSVTASDSAREAETTAPDVDRGYSSWINRKIAARRDDVALLLAQARAEAVSEMADLHAQVVAEMTENHARVVAQMQAVEERRRQALAQHVVERRRRLSNWGLVASLLILVSSVGLSIMPNFLDADWQIALFDGLIATGLIGAGISLIARWDKGIRDDGPQTL